MPRLTGRATLPVCLRTPRPRLRMVGGWLAAFALAVGGIVPGAVAVANAAGPEPQPTVSLPVAVEAPSPYLPQRSCDPVARTGVVAFRALMLATYGRGHDGGMVRACSIGGSSEHKEGRAWDWMLAATNPADRAAADSVLQWLTRNEAANARRTGVMYIVWNHRIWSVYNQSAGWRAYSGANPHTDHIHFSFSWAGATGRTSWWTGTVAQTDYGPCPLVAGQLAPKYTQPRFTPCPPPAPATPPTPSPVPSPKADTTKPSPLAGYYDTVLSKGSRGSAVKALQAALEMPTRYHTGYFGNITKSEVVKFQKAHGLPATGVVRSATWKALG